jgi:lycopene beta-cyclase
LDAYDIIIAGGGCAGLSLAYHLERMGSGKLSVLIVDREEKKANDRTWCFWSSAETGFESLVRHSWSFLDFIDERGRRRAPLGKYTYQMLRSDDFYRFIRRRLAGRPGIHWMQAAVEELGEDEAGAYARVDGRRLRARWIFNSCLPPGQSDGRYYRLLQHFRGWIIETEADAFDPEAATLMDFRTPQRGSTRFCYVLPFSARRALVEYTVFSAQCLPEHAYRTALQNYIRQQLNIETYEIRETEAGVIPMTNAPFPPRRSPRVINIGTAGGAVKPTTGYAFLTIQEQTRQIAERLLAGEAPEWTPATSRRFRFYDTLLLHILQMEGDQAKPIFQRLFRRNDFETILRFLEERSGIREEAGIFASLPFAPFLRALLQAGKISLPSWPVSGEQPAVSKQFFRHLMGGIEHSEISEKT